jgi:phage baseplate assembly protein W
VSRSAKYTVEYKKPNYYSDFLNGFDVNPLTGLLAQVNNEDAVKQSIRNWVLTDRYERYEQPDKGSKLRSLLFENFDPIVQQQIIDNITETINNCEPRAELISVVAQPDYDNNQYIIGIVFALINIPQVLSLDIILKRVR